MPRISSRKNTKTTGPGSMRGETMVLALVLLLALIALIALIVLALIVLALALIALIVLALIVLALIALIVLAMAAFSTCCHRASRFAIGLNGLPHACCPGLIAVYAHNAFIWIAKKHIRTKGAITCTRSRTRTCQPPIC
jgi:uncharacterized membrane protein